nr:MULTISPECIES: hypothetical protein [Enterobacter]
MAIDPEPEVLWLPIFKPLKAVGWGRVLSYPNPNPVRRSAAFVNTFQVPSMAASLPNLISASSAAITASEQIVSVISSSTLLLAFDLPLANSKTAINDCVTSLHITL